MHSRDGSFKARISRAIVLISTAVTVALSLSTPTSDAAGSRLLFATIDISAQPASTVEALVSRSGIDGLGIEMPWSKIEVSQRKYDWSALDAAIRSAALSKKYVTLYLVGSPKPPIWLVEGGKARTFAGGNFSRGVLLDAVPWDQVYIAAYTEFLQAAAAHFKSLNMTPYIFALGVVAPQRDITIVGSLDGHLGNTPYNRAAYMTVCKQMVDTYARIFPSARLFVPAPSDSMICIPTYDPEFYVELMTYALAKHKQSCWLFSRDLSSSGSRNSHIFEALNQRTGVGYQLPCITAEEQRPANVARAVNIGLANKAVYFELPSSVALSSDSLILQTIGQIHH